MNVLGTATNTATVSLWSRDNLALYTPPTRPGRAKAFGWHSGVAPGQAAHGGVVSDIASGNIVILAKRERERKCPRRQGISQPSMPKPYSPMVVRVFVPKHFGWFRYTVLR